eukprot:COSAG04_NODE_69_length_29236_cov_15.813680_17_plen_288_part_00
MLAMRPSAILLLARAVSASAPPAPHSLRVDRADPELLDDGTPAPLVFGAALSPVLSWQLPTAGRGQRQHAYEIRLSARAPSGVALAWESGRVYDSEQEVRVPLALQHETEYEWQVRVWDAAAGHGHGNSLYALASAPDPVASAWSEPHAFETLVHQDAWAARNASWIGGGNELRGDFTVPTGKTIESARAYVTGLGAVRLSPPPPHPAHLFPLTLRPSCTVLPVRQRRSHRQPHHGPRPDRCHRARPLRHFRPDQDSQAGNECHRGPARKLSARLGSPPPPPGALLL